MDTINVATLNCWGLKYVSKNRDERMTAITCAFSNSHHDIVALQELWVERDYNRIRDALSHRLPYAKRFHSGMVGAGLAIFTRWPIIAVDMRPYSLNGEPIDVTGGDWFSGKAVGSVTIMHPVLGKVVILDTHMFAKGGEDGPEYKRSHRLVNAWEFSKVARQAAGLGHHVIAMGDFNSIPDSLAMSVILHHAGLHDAWAVTHSNTPPPCAQITPGDGIIKYGVTADSPLNTFCGVSLNSTVRKYQGKRLDYILFRQPSASSHHTASLVLECRDSKVILTDSIPGGTCSFSDHFGVEASFAITAPTGADIFGPDASEAFKSTTLVWAEGMSMPTLSLTIGALQTSYRISQQRSTRELTTFVICIVILLGIIVGSAWITIPWVNPITIFMTILIAWLATTSLYEGLIFGNWERRALHNTVEELDLHKQALSIGDSPALQPRYITRS